jgi:hypothetical protein
MEKYSQYTQLIDVGPYGADPSPYLLPQGEGA